MADDSFFPRLCGMPQLGASEDALRHCFEQSGRVSWTIKEIKMSDAPWRPLVHVLDICKAIACTLEAPRDIVHNQIFNVTLLTIIKFAQIIAEIFSGCQLSFGTVQTTAAIVSL